MKNLFLISIVLLGLFACEEDPQQALAKKQKVYYLNEKFVLLDRKETQSYDNDRDKPVNIRTWIINRVTGANDSIEVAEIMSESSDCGCQAGDNFAITDELWYNKKIGDELHFDFIRKDRFFKILRKNLETPKAVVYAPDYQSTTETPNEPTVNADMEKEKRMMEIERQKLALERELETLKSK